MNLVRLSSGAGLPGRSKRLLSSAAVATHQRSERAGWLRVAPPPRAVWKVPAAAAVDACREAPSITRQPSYVETSHFLLPKPSATAAAEPKSSAVVQPTQQVAPAPHGDLRLVEFMEQVKQELWEFGAMPLRKRFRVQSLLR